MIVKCAHNDVAYLNEVNSDYLDLSVTIDILARQSRHISEKLNGAQKYIPADFDRECLDKHL